MSLSSSRVAAALVGVVMTIALPESSSAQGDDDAYVGSETCAECHDVEWDAFARSIHFQTNTTGEWESRACESCHGPGLAHVDAGGDAPMMFGASDLSSASEKTDQCLTCHEARETTFRFRSADHPKGRVDCASCHEVHAETPTDWLLEPFEAARDDALAKVAGHKACLECHQEVRAASTSLVSRHRIEEGIVQCSDCHEQHDPSPRAELGGFQQETCFECHIDKRGPFVFEHQASRVEGCSSCHVPHGSPNRHMLQFQSVADQCYSCHIVVPGFHKGFPGAPVRFDATSVCTNCHSTIHGSNLDPYFLR